ncbi:MAG: hypothetical protein J2P21_15235, partial [Chloracidobacterium sp.]|nr:hypothetical protein [Chloracidobacterium sp.]
PFRNAPPDSPEAIKRGQVVNTAPMAKAAESIKHPRMVANLIIAQIGPGRGCTQNPIVLITKQL